MPLNHPHCHGLSDVGRVRSKNEDQFLIADLSKSMIVHQSTLMGDDTRLFSDVQGQLLLVADGMGGHAAGERASELTAATISNYVLQTMPWFLRLQHEQEEHLHDVLTEAVMKCEQAVEDEVFSAPSAQGMGTTLTMAYVIWPRMFVVHVGDSRCYLLRDGSLKQITRDHTLLREYEEQGVELSKEQRRQFGRVLVNTIGQGAGRLHPEVYQVEMQANDVVLLCSDGLSDMVEDDEIASVLLRHCGDEEKSCEALLNAANAAGGRDNSTVIVSRYSVSVPTATSDTAELPVIREPIGRDVS